MARTRSLENKRSAKKKKTHIKKEKIEKDSKTKSKKIFCNVKVDGKICGKAYAKKSNLTHHIRTKHQGLTWICPHCKEQQSSAYSHERHVNSVHGISMKKNEADGNQFYLKGIVRQPEKAKDAHIKMLCETIAEQQKKIKSLNEKLLKARKILLKRGIKVEYLEFENENENVKEKGGATENEESNLENEGEEREIDGEEIDDEGENEAIEEKGMNAEEEQNDKEEENQNRASEEIDDERENEAIEEKRMNAEEEPNEKEKENQNRASEEIDEERKNKPNDKEGENENKANEIIDKNEPNDDDGKPVLLKSFVGTPWAVVYTNNKLAYFYNPTTGVAIWERPKELIGIPTVDKAVSISVIEAELKTYEESKLKLISNAGETDMEIEEEYGDSSDEDATRGPVQRRLEEYLQQEANWKNKTK